MKRGKDKKALRSFIGNKIIEFRGKKWDYDGELDSKGNAFGYGIAVDSLIPDIRYTGTFRDNHPHGLCE